MEPSTNPSLAIGWSAVVRQKSIRASVSSSPTRQVPTHLPAKFAEVEDKGVAGSANNTWSTDAARVMRIAVAWAMAPASAHMGTQSTSATGFSASRSNTLTIQNGALPDELTRTVVVG